LTARGGGGAHGERRKKLKPVPRRPVGLAGGRKIDRFLGNLFVQSRKGRAARLDISINRLARSKGRNAEEKNTGEALEKGELHT